MAADPKQNPDVPFIDPIVREAYSRFKRCVEWEGTARERFIDDLKFRHGDAANGYQWPNAIRRSRDVDSRPCLTINIVQQHNLQIVNELKKEKSGIRIIPTGNGATKESADCLAAIIRRIEYRSNAQAAYALGAEFMVDAGIGWWRIVTDYAGDETFDQEIYIREIQDPLSVYMDPDIQTKDGSDAKFAFVFDNVPREEFEAAYPKFANLASLSPMGIAGADQDWLSKDHVRVCEYFRKVPSQDKLISLVDRQTGRRVTIRGSRMSKELRDQVLDDPQTRWRSVEDQKVEWKLIVADKCIDKTDWPGKYIPLVRSIGVETRIEGILDRKGHTRTMLDAQRMYNYNSSAQVEFVALQGKTPWVAPAAAIENRETYWNTANTVNHSILPWNHIDDDGNPVPAPVRANPPNFAPGYENGMTTAFNQMMMASGQWQNQMGMMGNERTGAAIDRRQSQGDTATFHFVDNYMDAIRYTGVQILDLIPKIYDTKRVIQAMGEDGVDFSVEMDPAARMAYLQIQGHNAEIARRIFNPAVGNYEVMAAVGPAFGTRRQETVQAMTLLLTQAPALTGLIGDLLLQAMDFKEASEAALRLKRMVPPQALGQGPSLREQQLTQQLQQAQQVLGKTLEAHAKDRLKLVGKDQMRDIDVYKAETDRMKALGDLLGVDQEGLLALVQQLVSQTLQTPLEPIIKANAPGLMEQSSAGLMTAPAQNGLAPGAPQLEFDLRDPTRHLRSLPLAGLVRERNV